jgi:hypothetical protein
MQALSPTHQTLSDRLQQYKQLLAALRSRTSNVQQDDVAVMEELDGMKSWLQQQLISLAGRFSLTYEVRTVGAACYYCKHASTH